MSLLELEGPLWSTRLVFPSGAPPSTMAALLAFIHFAHASIPFFCCSGVALFIIFSKSAPEALYRIMNFFIGCSSSLSSLAMAMLRHPNPRRRPSQLHAGAACWSLAGNAAALATARWPVRHCRGWHPVQCAGGADAAFVKPLC